jgi:hypothetical protein
VDTINVHRNPESGQNGQMPKGMSTCPFGSIMGLIGDFEIETKNRQNVKIK